MRGVIYRVFESIEFMIDFYEARLDLYELLLGKNQIQKKTVVSQISSRVNDCFLFRNTNL